MGEFSELCGYSIAEICENRCSIAGEFAKEYGVCLVLKDAETLVINPDGEYYLHKDHVPALAQAGSGDVLSGIIAGLTTLTGDLTTAACMVVWLHGYLAQMAMDTYTPYSFPLESFPEQMNRFLKNHRL